MNRTAAQLMRWIWIASGVALLTISGFFQHELNRQRDRAEASFGRATSLDNAPPVLAFTTVALGGFRGLIANALWIRANDLQAEEKFFEMVQLADWITKLEPHFTQVWIVQAWNMAYNISVKFSDPADRWRWVRRGIELLRDEGIRFNPREALLYRELAWFFQHKIGQNLDDANNFYKQQWAREMTTVLGGGRPDYDQLLHPRTAEATNRVKTLETVYRMDPAEMQRIDAVYGPLDWRLPEPHAIYWAVVGIERSKAKGEKDLITLRRVIYASMQQLVLRGRILLVRPDGSLAYAPDLSKIQPAFDGFEKMTAEEKEKPLPIQRAERNFLKEVIYQLYLHNQISEANRWLKIIREKFPDAIPPGQTMDEFVLNRIAANLPAMDLNRTRALIGSWLLQSFSNLILDEPERAIGYERQATLLWNYYSARIGGQTARISLPPLPEMKKLLLDELLDPKGGWPPDLQARLRNALGLPPATNSPPPTVSPGNPAPKKP